MADVEQAENPEEALRLLQRVPPPAVVLYVVLLEIQ